MFYSKNACSSAITPFAYAFDFDLRARARSTVIVCLVGAQSLFAKKNGVEFTPLS